MTKLVRISLAIFLSVSLCTTATAQGNVQVCYTPAEVDKIAGLIKESDALRFELAEYKKLQVSSVETAWYSDPTMVVGGVVVSLSVGALIGYAVGRGR